MITDYAFGDWLPDVVDYKNPGLEECANVIPAPSGYSPVLSLIGRGASVTGTVIGAQGFEQPSGGRIICVATTTDIFVIVNDVVTASTLGLSLSGEDHYTFQQFGSSVYATAKNGGTYYLPNVALDTAFVAALGTPPKANAMGRLGDFLLMGNLIDIDVSEAVYRVRWSQFNNPAGTWGTDIATQAGAVDLHKDQGEVVAIAGGDFALVFQKYGISRMTYTGGSAVFAKDLFESDRGCSAPESVVRVGSLVYFLSHDGFFVTNGSEVTSISRGKIWAWFSDTANPSRMFDVQGAVDWANRCIVWVFSDKNGTELNRQVYYNWETSRWTYAEQDMDYIILSDRDGATLESIATDYPDIDLMDISLDSPLFKAEGRAMLAIVGGEISEFTGATLEARFELGSIQPATGRRTYVSTVTPLIEDDAQSSLVTIGTRDLMTTSPVYSTPVPLGPLGFAAVASDGRYHRIKVQIPSGSAWKDAYGVQVDYSISGKF